MEYAIGGGKSRRDVWNGTMEVPAIHGYSFHPWMEGRHPWMAGSMGGMQHMQASLRRYPGFIIPLRALDLRWRGKCEVGALYTWNMPGPAIALDMG